MDLNESAYDQVAVFENKLTKGRVEKVEPIPSDKRKIVSKHI